MKRPLLHGRAHLCMEGPTFAWKGPSLHGRAHLCMEGLIFVWKYLMILLTKITFKEVDLSKHRSRRRKVPIILEVRYIVPNNKVPKL